MQQPQPHALARSLRMRVAGEQGNAATRINRLPSTGFEEITSGEELWRLETP